MDKATQEFLKMVHFLVEERDASREERILRSKDPESAYYYAFDVIEGPWPEAEPFIMKDPRWAYYYARNVIKGPWPEAEPFIMKRSGWACDYALNVIKGRWPEAEERIYKSGYGELYRDLFCSLCEGQGYEEISGGEKIECSRCYGCGFDPSEYRDNIIS